MARVIDYKGSMSKSGTKKQLDVHTLCEEARRFVEIESTHPEPAIYGVTDRKAVGTYFEHKSRLPADEVRL